jgi:hypothetical protein
MHRTTVAQNVRQMSDKFESQHSLSPTIWSDILVLVGHFGRTFWSDVRVDIKRFFFTFLEVNMSTDQNVRPRPKCPTK